jgi:hypothetical protein
VHFPDDNIAGLNLGQEILARELPGHLQAKYGSDPAAVAAKVATLRFDWNDFLSSDCGQSLPIVDAQLPLPGTPWALPAGSPTHSPKQVAPNPLLTLSPTDLDIRFNKVVLSVRLGYAEYPVNETTATLLRNSNGASVLREDCFECSPKVSFRSLIDSIGGLPTHPSRNSDSPYWERLREVVTVQQQRARNVDPHLIMPLPQAWENYTIQDVAAAVHDELPGIHHVTLIKQLMAEGVKYDRTIITTASKKEFVRGPVMLSDMNTWAIGMIAPLNFGIKWYAGR